MTDQYFVISTSEDGDVSMYVYSKDHLEAEIGEGSYLDPKNEWVFDQSISDLRERSGFLIIRGELVSPHPVTKVTKYEVK
jgi:hypothetical protein